MSTETENEKPIENNIETKDELDDSKLEKLSDQELIFSLSQLPIPTERPLYADQVIDRMTEFDAAIQIRKILEELKSLWYNVSREDVDIDDVSMNELSGRAFGKAINRYAGNHALQALRSTETARDLVEQVAFTVNCITTIGQDFNIDLDGEKVESSKDFGKWRKDKLRRLTLYITTHVSSLIRQNESKDEIIARYRDRVAELERKEAVFLSEKNDSSRIFEANLENKIKSIKHLNDILSSHIDQKSWVVTQVDSTTRQPINFFYETNDGKLKKTKNYTLAIVNSIIKAREIRWYIVKHLRETVSANKYRTVGDSIIIKQITLATVDFSEKYEE
jgi:hypothetical protein